MSAVDSYLASLPADRRAIVEQVRDVVNARMPAGFEEAVLYGMITWSVPLARLPNTYNGQPLLYAGLASHKSTLSLYLMCVYGDTRLRADFEAAFKRAGKRLNIGKSCVRFKALDDLPLDVVGDAIARVTPDAYIRIYEESRAGLKPKKRGRAQPSRSGKGRVAAKKKITKKPRAAVKKRKRAR